MADQLEAAPELIAQPGVDGLFVGRQALDPVWGVLHREPFSGLTWRGAGEEDLTRLGRSELLTREDTSFAGHLARAVGRAKVRRLRLPTREPCPVPTRSMIRSLPSAACSASKRWRICFDSGWPLPTNRCRAAAASPL